MSSETVELLRQLIRNACVNDGTVESGQEARSVATLVDFFGVEGEIFEPAPGRQSLIYRVQGSDPSAPSLTLLPHLDVVPADPKGWTHNPFEAMVSQGFVYGRGAVDMLNVAAALASAVRPYLRGELTPRGDLIFAAVADEESGGRYGAGALVEERWDLVGAEYVITEVAYPKTSAGAAVPVAVGEKGVFWSILKATGTPGHGSLPYASDNALEKLVRALHSIIETPTPVAITEEWRSFVEEMDLEDELKRALVDPDGVDGAIDDLAAVDGDLARYAHAMTHLTISANEAVAGVKGNVIADRARAGLDVRALPGTDRAGVDAHLAKAMGSGRDEIEVVPIKDSEASISATDNPLWEAIADGVEEMEGHRELLPTMMSVGTDARFFRHRGSIAYGVGLFDERMTFAQMLSTFHGHDERVSTESVEMTARLYQRILHHFCGP